MRRVAIITTLDHNVGDDFVREGIVHLLRGVLGGFEELLIHKHLPITARPELAWVHSSGLDRGLDRLRPGVSLRATALADRLLPVFPWSDKICRADILVQSGAPIYWLHAGGTCAHTEWWDPLIERRWVGQAKGRPFLNLAGGTCQHYHSDGSEFAANPEALAYIRRFYDLCSLTTLRDELSVDVLRHAGRQGELLPCTSIFAVDKFGIKPSPGRYVAVNFMPGGGHYTFGQPIDSKAWENRFAEFVRRLSKRERCVAVCHDHKELAAAKRLFPDVPVFWSKSHEAYLRCYAEAKYGILNRVHGGFAMASLGKPSVVIGADSRARMAPMVGVESVFVNDASAEWLEAQPARLERMAETFGAEMTTRKQVTKLKYLELISEALQKPQASS